MSCYARVLEVEREPVEPDAVAVSTHHRPGVTAASLYAFQRSEVRRKKNSCMTSHSTTGSSSLIGLSLPLHGHVLGSTCISLSLAQHCETIDWLRASL